MPLKQTATKQRRFQAIEAVSYRVPLEVWEVLLSRSGVSYPICPRCNNSLDREYMRFCDRCGQHLAWEFLDYAKVIHAPRRKNDINE